MKTKAPFLLLILVSCCYGADSNSPGFEFRDIHLDVPIIDHHPNFGQLKKDTLPSLDLLQGVLSLYKSEPILFLEVYRDGQDHYAPTWSMNGQSMAFIRADLERKTSKIEILENLSSQKTRTLFEKADSYDYMFTWAPQSIASKVGFCFASTNNPAQVMNLYLGSGAGNPYQITDSPKLKKHPHFSIMNRGVYQLLFEQEGHLFSTELDESDNISPPQRLIGGSFPKWSLDGSSIVFVHQRATSKGTEYALYQYHLQNSNKTTVIAPATIPLRNPTWSPNGNWIAYYIAGGMQGEWDLAVTNIHNPDQSSYIAKDVVVENNFDNMGPAWSPDSKKLFFFARKNQEEVTTIYESYYRLLSKGIEPDSSLTAMDYHRRYTTAIGISVNPKPNHPEVMFAATKDLAQSIYVLILNHF